ncbi:MAG: DedA family protein [Patescibacteria group bacterium]
MLIKSGGYLGLFAIIFAESGLFFGFFLPGDSLIFTAGFLASQNYLNIWLLIPILFIAAVLGDNFGYGFGKKVGPKIFTKKDSLFFDQENLNRANLFYEKHGAKTLILARFMPVIRTFAPILAGVGQMDYAKFFLYNLVGGALWTISLPLLGYYLGRTIPDIDKYLLPIILLIIFLSILPSLIGFIKSGQSR